MTNRKFRALLSGAVAVAAVGALATEVLASPAGATREQLAHARTVAQHQVRPDAAPSSEQLASTPLELAVELATQEHQETLVQRDAIVRFVAARIAAEQARAAESAAQVRRAQTTRSSSSAGSSSGGATSGGSGSTLACIRAHESDSAGGYSAVNSSSGAGGAYQALPSTWDGYAGYARAQDAPAVVQDQWAREAIASSGTRPWAGSGC
ncbi:MAG TPA: transglycosylase family protein [Acidimicrobiia bacterium]|nr:transglycosylase family protein [Acidimicrobiia bacterium]